MKRSSKLAVLPNPKGRVDLLLSGLVERSVKLLIEPRSKELWGVIAPYVKSAASKQISKLGISKKPLTPDELQLVQRLLSAPMPREGASCT